MFEDDAPKPEVGYRLGDELEKWSVGELRDLLEALRAEIELVEAEIRRKQGDISSAESLFRS